MCGIFGVLGDFNYAMKDVVKELAIVTSIRGSHSSGIATVNTRTNKVNVCKAVGSPFDLFEQKSFDTVCSTVMNNVIFGHGRHATRGEINKANAHPFQHGTLTGIHNGTLDNYRELPVEPDYGTDSETLYACAAQYGMKDTLADCRGAWALMWYDSSDKTFNVVRNDQRPLWYCLSEDGRKMFIASEYWMLMAILGRNGIKMWFDEDKKSCFSFAKDTHYKIKSPENATTKIDIEVTGKWEGDTTKQHTAPFAGHTYTKPWDTWGRQKSESPAPNPAASGNTNTPTTSSETPTGERKVLSLPSRTPVSKPGNSADSSVKSTDSDNETVTTYPGYNDNRMSEEEWEEKTKEGCAFCGQSVDTEDAETISWISNDGFLCSECCGNKDIPQIPLWMM
jgi:predicted glutamine amidotransferase